MIKKTVISSIILALIFVQNAFAAAGTPGFSDVKPNDWFYSSVQTLVKGGILNGFSDGSFKPQSSVTRAELIKMTVMALQLPVETAKPGEPWYVPYVSAAQAAGIYNVKDFAATSTALNKPITRLETARVAVRAVDPDFKNSNDKELMYEATKRGIINGVANGELGKEQSSTRAQAAVIIDRMLQVIAGKTLPVDKRAASYAEVELRNTNMETMWGGHINPLPQTHDLSYALKGTFNQILIVDMDDKNSPYASWVKGFTLGNRSHGDNSYLMAFNVTMENTAVVKNKFLWFSSVSSNPYFNRGILIGNDNSPFQPVDERIDLSQLGNKVTTWYLAIILKDDYQKFKSRNEVFFYFDWTISKSFEFTDDGKIFS